MSTSSSFPLTYVRLRFHCQAETFLHLGGLRAGSNLRGALLGVMHRSTCDGDLSNPAHTDQCPVCWLTTSSERPGRERRGYVITPPLNNAECLAPGEAFDFHVTLFGDAIRYLPYFVLAVPEAGCAGVGIGRGRFALLSIMAEYPKNEVRHVWKTGKAVVHLPEKPVNHSDVLSAAAQWAAQQKNQGGSLCIEYKTPLRLIAGDQLLKVPDFGAFFRHLLMRLDDLAVQQASSAPRLLHDRQHLWGLASRVRLMGNKTHWVEVSSGSSRTGQSTWISGLVGQACYSAPVNIWQDLLPWILWGQVAQVGKDTVKGNGVFQFIDSQ